MKKVILIIFCFAFFGFIIAEVWTDMSAYDDYKTKKTEAKEAEQIGDFLTAYDLYVECANIAKRYATLEIAAWMLNNAAYMLIKEHKRVGAFAIVPPLRNNGAGMI